jgi:Domain of unknown function (DUF6924)
MPSLPVVPDAGSSHLVRTDFASSDAWEQVREQAQDLYAEEGQDPDEYGLCARIVLVSDTAFDGASWHAVTAPAGRQ